jgi:Rrf2 family protein
MKLSLKVEYACQVLSQLALTYGRTEMPHIDDLAEAEHIPSNYLVQILNELRNNGLIVSRRGKQGGYSLARGPKEISLYDIVCAVDGEILGFSSHGKGASASRVKEVWKEIATELEQKTKGILLQNLVEGSSDPMWYI